MMSAVASAPEPEGFHPGPERAEGNPHVAILPPRGAEDIEGAIR